MNELPRIRGPRLVQVLLFYPLTWATLPIIVIIEWSFIKWFQPPLIINAIILIIGVGLLLLWPFCLLRSQDFLKFYYKIPEKAKKEDLERQKTLEADLGELQFPQGIEQLRMLREKLDNLTEVLKRRLNAGELTFGRYLLAGQQVYLSAVDNLHDVAVMLRSVSTIDRAYIDDRLSELQKLTKPTEEQTKEVASMEQRKSLFDQQMTKVTDLMSQNESAMTVLDNTAAALADTKTGTARASIDPEAAMAELEMLAERAGKYASSARS